MNLQEMIAVLTVEAASEPKPLACDPGCNHKQMANKHAEISIFHHEKAKGFVENSPEHIFHRKERDKHHSIGRMHLYWHRTGA